MRPGYQNDGLRAISWTLLKQNKMQNNALLLWSTPRTRAIIVVGNSFEVIPCTVWMWNLILSYWQPYWLLLLDVFQCTLCPWGQERVKSKSIPQISRKTNLKPALTSLEPCSYIMKLFPSSIFTFNWMAVCHLIADESIERDWWLS